MAKKMKVSKVKKTSGFEQELKNMSFADLHAMYMFVAADFNKQFGTKVEAKKLIHERYKMILEELNLRAYGGNPYDSGKVEVNGKKPEDIDLSLFEEKSNWGPNEPQRY